MADLSIIARLEYAKAVEELSQETQERLRNELAAMPRGGQLEAARLKIRLEQSEKGCRVLAQIWQSLLEEKNGGFLTRADVSFIVQQVREVAAARKSAMLNSPDRPPLVSAAGTIARSLDSVAGSIGRDLEIRIRRQEAFPKKESVSEKANISVTIHQAANVNLGSQVGTINAALNVISQAGGANTELAEALKRFTDQIAADSHLKDTDKHETLDVIGAIVEQAEAKPETRSSGKLRALLSGMPSMLTASKDLLELWDRISPFVKQHFGLG
jgi:hypothetical protein